MHKAELIEKMAQEFSLSKNTTKKLLDGLLRIIVSSLSEWESVGIKNFWVFRSSTTTRNFSMPKNPWQLKRLQVTTIRFKPSKLLIKTKEV